MNDLFRQAVLDAVANPHVPDAVARIYADLQRQIDHRKPICIVSGRCCHFEEFGHRLFVTTMEMAAFLHGLPPERLARLSPIQDPTGCPFQINRLCSVHAIRPFGCRIFFCDPTAQEWQEGQYQAFHQILKHEHDRLTIPYHYVEWRQALQSMALIPTSTSPPTEPTP